MRTMRHLDVSGLTGVTGAGFATWAGGGAGVQLSLNLRGCYHISSASLAALLGGSVQLSAVNLGRCAVDDVAVAALCEGRSASLMQRLNLSECTAVTDDGLGRLRSCTALVSLTLAGCAQCDLGVLGPLLTGACCTAARAQH